jgi:membrane-bound lytic murein transglycosylase B
VVPREIVVCDGPFAVKVGWSDGQDVQVGVEGDDGRSLNWVLHGDNVERIGERTLAMIAEAGPSPDPAAVGRGVLAVLDVAGGDYRGVWANLDRYRCNRLVRLLRRARDAAFGADA